MVTVITICIVVVVIPIFAAATTNTVLPAANSATTVRARCRCCHIRGPVGGVVVDGDAVTAYAPAALPLPPSGVTDLMAAAMTKTRDGTAPAAATVTAAATEEEEYNGWEGANL